jgi:RES domain
MGNRPPPLPLPPAEPPSPRREIKLQVSELFTIGTRDDPLFERVPLGGPPRSRFDCRAFATVYASTALRGCIGELYADEGAFNPADGLHHFRLTHVGDLRVATLDDTEYRSYFRLDERICVGGDYAICQCWSEAFYNWGFDGISYASRLDDGETNYCLFASRCANRLTYERLGLLGLSPELEAAAERHALRARRPLRRPQRPPHGEQLTFDPE